MKLLHFDCSMGAAGDMLTAALLELFEDKESLCRQLNELSIPHVRFVMNQKQTCGLQAGHMQVLIDGEDEDHAHPHRGLQEVREIIQELKISDKVREDVLAVYDAIARAESAVHGVSTEHIHFHEVGSLDAIADITAVCYLMDLLQPDLVTASAVHVGHGHVKCAHGILPVPAPATARLLRGIPIYGGEVQGELCTPTGAALLRHFVSSFGAMPHMVVEKIGYGAGKKKFPLPNCVSAFWGKHHDETDLAVELSCNLDDMTPEHIGFAVQVLRNAGALDVATCPVYMKKDRPGTLLIVLCKPETEQDMVRLILRHTTTLGVRSSLCSRYILRRNTETVQTPYGSVRYKTAFGYDALRSKLEFDDLAQIATREGLSLDEIKETILR